MDHSLVENVAMHAFWIMTVKDESTWEILEATATRLHRSKPKNINPPTPIQTKTHKIPKPTHQNPKSSNTNLIKTHKPTTTAHRKDKERLERGTKKQKGEKRKKSSRTKEKFKEVRHRESKTKTKTKKCNGVKSHLGLRTEVVSFKMFWT